jgi:hypothetical protein
VESDPLSVAICELVPRTVSVIECLSVPDLPLTHTIPPKPARLMPFWMLCVAAVPVCVQAENTSSG